MNTETIKERLKKLLTQNIGLKIVSIIAATLLWFIMVSITDPVIPETYKNVPVRIINSDTVTSEGKTMEVVNNTDNITTVTIKAPRSVIQELGSSSDAIVAVADLRNLSLDEKRVPIDLSVSKYTDKVESIKASHESLEVSIETRRTTQLPIKATTSGEIEPGYVVGNVTQAQNQVRVSGPQSVIYSIYSAAVDVQVTGFKEKISTLSDIVLYDIDGNVIDDKNLELNVDSVRVDVEILATKKVPVAFSYSGTPADGYNTTGVLESDIEEVVIAGNANVIDRVNSISVPSSQLNVTGLTSSLHALIDIGDYLPSGIRFADPAFSGFANVTVYIEEYKEQSVSVYLRNIEVTGIPDGFSSTEWAESKDYVEFVLVGLAQDLEQIQLSQLNFTVDFNDYALMNDISGFKAGIYELPLLLDLPDDVWMKEPVEVKVRLVK